MPKMRTEFLLNEKTLRESINTIDGFSQSVTEAFLNFSKKRLLNKHTFLQALKIENFDFFHLYYDY